MESSSGHSKLWTSNFVLVLLANMGFYTASFLIIATIGQYFEELNAPDVYISLSLSSVSCGAFIMRFVAGNLLDTLGRKKMTYIGALALLLCYILYMFTGLNGTIIVRTVNGVAWGIVGTAMATICSGILHKDRLGDGLGFFAVSSAFCMAFSPMIAIIIYNNWGFSVILTFSVVIQVFAFICLVSIKMPNVKLRKTEKGHLLSNIKDMFEKKAIFPGFLNLLINISMCGINSFIILHGTSLGIKSVWIYFVGHLGAVMVSRAFSGKVSEKMGIMYVILPGMALMTSGMLILWLAKTLPFIILASIFFGLGFGSAFPALQAWTLDRSPDDRRGAANGMFLSAMDFAAVFGAFVLTGVMSGYGTAEIYLVAAGFLVIAMVIVIIRRKEISEENRKSKFHRDLELAEKLKL